MHTDVIFNVFLFLIHVSYMIHFDYPNLKVSLENLDHSSSINYTNLGKQPKVVYHYNE